jgi:predicted metal-dependent TIM-barrel fold hydrolase
VKLFDPHIHMISRTTDDYEAMARAGIRGVIEPAFWLGQPRTSVGTGRIDADELADAATFDQAALFAGNSVLRGQSPRRTPDRSGPVA